MEERTFFQQWPYDGEEALNYSVQEGINKLLLMDPSSERKANGK